MLQTSVHSSISSFHYSGKKAQLKKQATRTSIISELAVDHERDCICRETLRLPAYQARHSISRTEDLAKLWIDGLRSELTWRADLCWVSLTRSRSVPSAMSYPRTTFLRVWLSTRATQILNSSSSQSSSPWTERQTFEQSDRERALLWLTEVHSVLVGPPETLTGTNIKGRIPRLRSRG